MQAWLNDDLMPDGLHPNVAGLDVIACGLHPFLQQYLRPPPTPAAGAA